MRKLTRTIALVGTLSVLATATSQVASRPIARAGGSNHFEIFFRHIDEMVTLGRYVFPLPLWEFGDRAGYRCAWAFLMSGGQPVARVQFDRGQTYTQINDAFGQETDNDFSQCIPEEQRELKPKPAGLGDTIVDFAMAGVPLATLTFPATSPTDADSWWEFEEQEGGVVEVELYWKQDVAVVATLTSLSPALSLSVRSTALPAIGSFSPASGGVGTEVTVLGANFIGVTSVRFNGAPASFESHSGGELVATVPAGATSGPITVVTPAGTVASSSSFTIVSGTSFRSSVSLDLSGRLVASGSVDMIAGGNACLADRTVVIQRRVSGEWKSVGYDRTDQDGEYRKRIANRSGIYRSTVERETLANGDVCRRDVSSRRTN